MMKKLISAVTAVIQATLILNPIAVNAAIGDIYPASGMSATSGNAIISELKAQNNGEAGAIVQTNEIWRYQYAARDDFSEAAYKDMGYKNANKQLQIDENTSYPRQFDGYNCQPGNDYDVVMTFIAPESGTVEISNVNVDNMIKCNTNGTERQDGVYAKILYNEDQIWPDNGEWAGVCPTAVQDTVYQYVSAGDKIHFRVNKNKYIDNDGTLWNPTVKYVNELYFPQDIYYCAYTNDNEGNSYESINRISIPAVKINGLSGTLEYETSDNTVIEPDAAQDGTFNVKGVGSAVITARLYNEDTVIKEAETAVEVYDNNIGGPYDYSWNGSVSQGPVWYYKSLVPAGSEESNADNYEPLDIMERNSQHSFFKISSGSEYGYIRTDNRIHPGKDGSPTLAFKAPRTGLVEIGALDGLYPQIVDTSTKDGIRYRICHNDETVYPQKGGYAVITPENVGKEDNYGTLKVNVQEGDYIYFTIDKNANTDADLSAWSPTVKYLSVSFDPNPFELTDTISVAPNFPVADRGFDAYDSLQMAYEAGQAQITVSGTSANASCAADASSPKDSGGEMLFDGDGTVDIVFQQNYTGSRTIKDIQLMLHSSGGESSNYSIDFYYSTTEDKDTLIQMYSAAETRTQSFVGYPFIRLGDFNGAVNDVYKIHIVINDRFGMKTKISEIDLNMAEDSTEVQAKRTEKKSAVSMPRVFTDNMVIQREKPIRLWGYGGTDKVFVELKADGQAVRSGYAVVSDGIWNIEFEALPGGHTKYTLNVTDGADEKNCAEVKNILIGDIWIASGQSNMDFSMYKTSTYEQDIELAVYDEIRYFSQQTMGAMEPLADSYYGAWSEAVGENIRGYSAVAYQFARELYEQTDRKIPIAIVAAKMSGTRIQAWMPEELLQSDPDFAAVNNLRTADVFANPTSSASFGQRAAASFNAMVNPLLCMNIKGAVWYQGEENSFQPDFYKKALPSLMKCWRDKFRDEEMPFYIVQLPSYASPATNAKWPEMREVQLQTALSDINSGIVVTTDLGEKNDIHPTNKRPVGQRLAYTAAAKTYGVDVEYSGPLYDKITLEGDNVIVHFTHSEGLKAQIRNKDYNSASDSQEKEFTVDDSGVINGFELSQDGKNFVTAQAVISGNTVVVSGVENPTALRFGWTGYAEPELNLFNGANLPASPFRVSSFSDKQDKPEPVLYGSAAYVSGVLRNNSRLMLNANVILASYCRDGRLEEVKMCPVSAVINDSTEYNADIQIPEGGSVRAFIWNSMMDIVPLSEAGESLDG